MKRRSAALLLLALVGLVGPGEAQVPRKYALLIGIEKYLHLAGGIRQLDYAEDDVLALEKVLEAQGYDEVVVLTNDRAERVDILNHLYRFAEIVREQDTFLLHFSGHGVRNSLINGETYWLTYDASLELLDGNGIRLDHLLDYVRDVKAKQKLILLDHCFSGDVLKVAGGGEGRAGGGGVAIDTRAVFRVDAWRDQLARRAEGLVILAAARDVALESAQLGHGLFTAALLDAFAAGPHDSNADRKLSLLELVAFLGPRLEALSQQQGGQLQQIVTQLGVSDVQDWYLVDSLPVSGLDEAKERKERSIRTLRRWEQRGWLTFGSRIRCNQVLELWLATFADGPALGGVDASLLDEIFKHVETTTAPEDLLARDLQDVVDELEAGAGGGP